MDDRQKADIRTLAKRYRTSVAMGDCSAYWASTDVAGVYTYPYATVDHFEAVREYAAKFVK